MYIFHLELDFLKIIGLETDMWLFSAALYCSMRSAVSNTARYNNGQYGSVAHK